MRRFFPALSWILTVSAVLALFWPVLENGFVYDDHLVITQGADPERPAQANLFLSQRYYAWSGESSYRPVTTLSYLLDRAVFGPAPRGFHLTNVLLHAGCVLALALTARRLGLSAAAVALSALWFAVHPAQVEAVAGIAFREDPLAALFMLLALGQLLPPFPPEANRGTSAPRIAALFLLSLLSMLSKETGFMLLPAVALVWAVQRLGQRPAAARQAAMAAAVVLAALLAGGLWQAWRPSPDAGGEPTSESLAARLGELPDVFGYYVQTVALPVRLGVDPHLARIHELRWLPFLGAAAGVALLVRRRAWRALFGLGLAALGLAPVVQIIPIFNPVAERFLYLPMAGLALALGAGLDAAGRRSRGGRRSLALLLAIVCLGYLPLTAAQMRVWHSELTLFTAAVQSNPYSSRAHYNLGRAQQRAGLLRDAARHYRVSAALHPGKGFVHYNLGQTLAALDEMGPAEREFEISARLLPRDPEPWNNLGVIAAQQGRLTEALVRFENALARDPHSIKILQNLYTTCVQLGQTERANWAAEEAARLLQAARRPAD